jgi:hypothetical protein
MEGRNWEWEVVFLIELCSGFSSGEHYSYAGHSCPGAYRKNVQVPVCPLCNAPVPGKVDELPDIRVSRHIDADCRSDTAVNRRQVGSTYKKLAVV